MADGTEHAHSPTYAPPPRPDRRALVTAGLMVVALCAYLFFLRGRDFVITLTEAQIQERLDASFPITRTYLRFFKATYASPRVTFLQGTDRVRVELDVTLNILLPGQTAPLGGSIAVTTGLRYDDPRNAFCLKDPTLEAIQVQGVPDRHISPARLHRGSPVRIPQHSPRLRPEPRVARPRRRTPDPAERRGSRRDARDHAGGLTRVAAEVRLPGRRPVSERASQSDTAPERPRTPQ